jgi:hypothetical protein
MWIGGTLLVLVLIVGGVIAYLLKRAEPMMRAALIDTLQKRFNAHVELDHMHVSIVDGFRVEANGLRIWLPDSVQQQSADNAAAMVDPSGKSDVQRAAQAQRHTQPWIVVGKMWFHATWHIRPGEPIVVSVIHVQDVQVVLPPKQERPKVSLNGKNSQTDDDESESNNQQAASQSTPSQSADTKSGNNFFKLPRIEVRKVECNTAVLFIERRQEAGKNKAPLEFDFSRVTLIPDGHGGPIYFDVDMTNARPVGQIHTTGHLGPWVAGDPHLLPLEGDYTFAHADLGTIKGIEGILSSSGHYSGTLNAIETEGITSTPDFRLERVNKGTGVLLTTHFKARVDGTNGNTYLHSVDAMLGRTHILAIGQVVRADDIASVPAGTKGHDITLDVTIDRGRIEDILQIAADAERPFMTGNLMLKTKYHQPPGPVSVVDKLLLDGQFHLTQARFSSESIQSKIVQLSLRGQGKPGDVKTTDPTDIFSEMQGHFKLGNGMLQLPDLNYQVPGAEIVAQGNYGLKAGSLDFVGDAKLDASLSQVIGGWKGFLLKPADHFLRKNGAGLDVPIHVNGTRKDPKFGVDFGRLGKTDKPGKDDELYK